MSFDNKKHLKLKRNAWDDILCEVLEKKADGQKTALLSDAVCETAYRKAKNKFIMQKLSTRYVLEGKHGVTHFTGRETECMALLLKSKSANDIATTLKLSLNEVQLYIRNMKTKVGCDTDIELIDLVRTNKITKNSDFFKEIV